MRPYSASTLNLIAHSTWHLQAKPDYSGDFLLLKDLVRIDIDPLPDSDLHQIFEQHLIPLAPELLFFLAHPDPRYLEAKAALEVRPDQHPAEVSDLVHRPLRDPTQ